MDESFDDFKNYIDSLIIETIESNKVKNFRKLFKIFNNKYIIKHVISKYQLSKKLLEYIIDTYDEKINLDTIKLFSSLVEYQNFENNLDLLDYFYNNLKIKIDNTKDLQICIQLKYILFMIDQKKNKLTM
ncbi:ORF MSV037 hypothetical protein [Melanoplus sanguinipes entomopoxvirus]|uniref:Uncharacterized protein n=1 Tax=Melanoplus sanguinipes entomopoxvirus TaxID=83191 RepID=Q9YW55_MSEPV|nr:ORF MSV037 hypothetical protein [Melanoplus sanguinipes entomopoxvirus]AAC97836.1 ORF MSV037 hypothetical protein [Melanoplus sanguinipes entomopoxvirus 'O']